MDGITASDLPLLTGLFATIGLLCAFAIWRFADADRSDRIDAKFGKFGTWLWPIFIGYHLIRNAIDHDWIWVGLLAALLGLLVHQAVFDIRRRHSRP